MHRKQIPYASVDCRWTRMTVSCDVVGREQSRYVWDICVANYFRKRDVVEVGLKPAGESFPTSKIQPEITTHLPRPNTRRR